MMEGGFSKSCVSGLLTRWLVDWLVGNAGKTRSVSRTRDELKNLGLSRFHLAAGSDTAMKIVRIKKKENKKSKKLSGIKNILFDKR